MSMDTETTKIHDDDGDLIGTIRCTPDGVRVRLRWDLYREEDLDDMIELLERTRRWLQPPREET